MSEERSSAGDVVAALQPVDLSTFLDSGEDESACKALAESLREFGAALVIDHRFAVDDAADFRHLMERYFEQARAEKMKDVHPEVFYQVGATPDHVELPRTNPEFVASVAPSEAPVSADSVAARKKDPKWRFFWRIGARPAPDETKFPALNAPQVVPEAFKDEWSGTLDRFGEKLLHSVETSSEMLALGLDLERDAFRAKLNLGPHLLAPTGAELSLPTFQEPGAVLAGFHYDFNFLTIHSAASYPGLYIWTRQGQRLQVRVPKGMLLLQAGCQLEHLTGGHIKRGFHEVVVTDAAIQSLRDAQKERKSVWRISSTFFSHVRSDESLAPLGNFGKEGTDYGEILAGDHVASELKAIALCDDA